MTEKSSELPEPEVTPISADDVISAKPPPSYEEVLGQYMTSLTDNQSKVSPAVSQSDDSSVSQSSPRPLAYIDIMPRLLKPGNLKEKMAPTFQSFR